MNQLSPREVLPALRSALRKIEADPEPTTSVLKLRRILKERIERLEALQRLMSSPAADSGTSGDSSEGWARG